MGCAGGAEGEGDNRGHHSSSSAELSCRCTVEGWTSDLTIRNCFSFLYRFNRGKEEGIQDWGEMVQSSILFFFFAVLPLFYRPHSAPFSLLPYVLAPTYAARGGEGQTALWKERSRRHSSVSSRPALPSIVNPDEAEEEESSQAKNKNNSWIVSVDLSPQHVSVRRRKEEKAVP